jgi:choline dehydrogenase-like flavoprotein
VAAAGRARLATCAPVTRRHFDWLIVGAGFTGAVLAERIARGLDKSVLVIDRRPHVAGNAFDDRVPLLKGTQSDMALPGKAQKSVIYVGFRRPI